MLAELGTERRLKGRLVGSDPGTLAKVDVR